MTRTLVCLDAVWEHDPEGRLIRRIAGTPTPKTPTGKWQPYLRFVAGSHSGQVADPHEPPQPGRPLLILRQDDGRGSTRLTTLVLRSDVIPAMVWRPADIDHLVRGPSGIEVLAPHMDPLHTTGLAGILNVAAAMPDPSDHAVRAGWYWPAAQIDVPGIDVPMWGIVDRYHRTPLLLARDRQHADTVAGLLARLPIPDYAHVISALTGATAWEVGPTALHHADDDVVVKLLVGAGWPAEEVQSISPTARRELLLKATAIEQAGAPWPLVQAAWEARR